MRHNLATMRRLLMVLLLVALLPLRSWAGDAMAIQMAANEAKPAVTRMHQHADLGNCHEMQASADTVAAMPESPTSGHCATCAFCQACFTSALAMPVTTVDAQPLPYALPQLHSSSYTSAILALSQKPPIS